MIAEWTDLRLRAAIIQAKPTFDLEIPRSARRNWIRRGRNTPSGAAGPSAPPTSRAEGATAGPGHGSEPRKSRSSKAEILRICYRIDENWRPSSAALESHFAPLMRKRLPWLDHYNMACVDATPLLAEWPVLSKSEDGRLREVGIRAAHNDAAVLMETDLLARKRSWILSEGSRDSRGSAGL